MGKTSPSQTPLPQVLPPPIAHGTMATTCSSHCLCKFALNGVATPPSGADSVLAAKRAVWAALDSLSPRRRAIVVLSELDGMTPEAIAALLGVAVVTVRWHLSRARRELRRVLAPHMER